MKDKDVDMVDHPPHYTSHPSGVECIEVVEHMTFNIGNCVKYLWRIDEKDKPEEDLDKAIWYLNREKKKLKKIKEQKEKELNVRYFEG